jgi:hypothetical protein
MSQQTSRSTLKTDITHQKLIRDLDAKWGHTYEEPSEEEEQLELEFEEHANVRPMGRIPTTGSET